MDELAILLAVLTVCTLLAYLVAGPFAAMLVGLALWTLLLFDE